MAVVDPLICHIRKVVDHVPVLIFDIFEHETSRVISAQQSILAVRLRLGAMRAALMASAPGCGCLGKPPLVAPRRRCDGRWRTRRCRLVVGRLWQPNSPSQPWRYPNAYPRNFYGKLAERILLEVPDFIGAG
jgi:hypothetical protein